MKRIQTEAVQAALLRLDNVPGTRDVSDYLRELLAKEGAAGAVTACTWEDVVCYWDDDRIRKELVQSGWQGNQDHLGAVRQELRDLSPEDHLRAVRLDLRALAPDAAETVMDADMEQGRIIQAAIQQACRKGRLQECVHGVDLVCQVPDNGYGPRILSVIFQDRSGTEYWLGFRQVRRHGLGNGRVRFQLRKPDIEALPATFTQFLDHLPDICRLSECRFLSHGQAMATRILDCSILTGSGEKHGARPFGLACFQSWKGNQYQARYQLKKEMFQDARLVHEWDG